MAIGGLWDSVQNTANMMPNRITNATTVGAISTATSAISTTTTFSPIHTYGTLMPGVSVWSTKTTLPSPFEAEEATAGDYPVRRPDPYKMPRYKRTVGRIPTPSIPRVGRLENALLMAKIISLDVTNEGCEDFVVDW